MEIRSTDIIENEKALGAQIEQLALTDIEGAQRLCFELTACALSQAGSLSRAQSAAFSRLICRFLLNKKCKSRLAELLRENAELRKAVFGLLNTYKYSLIFLLKRILRLNDAALTGEVLELLRSNEFEDSAAKPYSDRWSFEFVVSEALKAPEDYLALSEESKAVIAGFNPINNSDSSQ